MAGSWAENGVGFPSQVSPGFVLIWGFPYAAWCHLRSRNRQFYDVNDMERPSSWGKEHLVVLLISHGIPGGLGWSCDILL